jgi:hypothetical protein
LWAPNHSHCQETTDASKDALENAIFYFSHTQTHAPPAAPNFHSFSTAFFEKVRRVPWSRHLNAPPVFARTRPSLHPRYAELPELPELPDTHQLPETYGSFTTPSSEVNRRRRPMWNDHQRSICLAVPAVLQASHLANARFDTSALAHNQYSDVTDCSSDAEECTCTHRWYYHWQASDLEPFPRSPRSDGRPCSSTGGLARSTTRAQQHIAHETGNPARCSGSVREHKLCTGAAHRPLEIYICSGRCQPS